MANDDGPPDRAALVAELNDLLQTEHDAVHAYTLAIQYLPRDAYSETLARFRGDHERHVAELGDLVRDHGGVPVQLPHIPTGAFKLAVQGVGAAGGLRGLLMAFKTNEAQVRDKYRRHADRTHTPDVDTVLRRAAADEETHYAWVSEMLDRMGSGTDTPVGLAQEILERVQGRAVDAVESVQRKVMEGVERLRPDRTPDST